MFPALPLPALLEGDELLLLYILRRKKPASELQNGLKTM
jgi:hypothetical protein